MYNVLHHRQLEERVGEIATNQLWEVKVTHDGQRAQAERDNQLHGAIGEFVDF